jgi:hypothetical protein
MTDLICIRDLMRGRNGVNRCIGRKESSCCVECRQGREHEAALQFYRENYGKGPVYADPLPEKEK